MFSKKTPSKISPQKYDSRVDNEASEIELMNIIQRYEKIKARN